MTPARSQLQRKIASIVEGDGEVEAIPALLRRIVPLVVPDEHVDVCKAVRLSRGKFLTEPEFERAFRFARDNAGDGGVVVVLADADDDCPVELSAKIRTFGCIQNSEIPVGVVFANRCFEAWLIAGAESLRGHRGLNDDLVSPDEPDGVANPKRWLQDRHAQNSGGQRRWRYSPKLDQPALSAVVDVALARRSPSFDKFYREIERLLTPPGSETAPEKARGN